jgi:hypothetical protein
MPVQVKATPNPNAMKFVVPDVRFAAPSSFASPQAAAANPLAAALFALDGVYNVFMAQDFVTVNKRPDVAWDSLSASITRIVEEYLCKKQE